MAVHMSVRLAWHSDGWNGHICKKPCENVYCVGQHSYPGTLIAETRDLDFEMAHAGESCAKHPCKIACGLSANASHLSGACSGRFLVLPPFIFVDLQGQQKYLMRSLPSFIF